MSENIKNSLENQVNSVESIDLQIINSENSDGAVSQAKQTKRQLVERFLQERFRFRYNVITGGVEFTRIGKKDWTELDDYKLNSICREIDRVLHLSLTSGLLAEYLQSDFVPTYHPIQHFFDSLPTVTGTVAINALAETVQVKNPDLFKEALTRWLVASVANVFTPNGCQNQACLVLTGEQGAFKSTWLNMLCPPDVLKYLYCGKIELQSKDTYVYLGTTFIINLDDQLRALNKRDDETLKTLITHPNITVRRPYDKYPSFMSRMASFCGSINSDDFLTDPTGSRRFLPFRVERIAIDQAKTIDINQVWAEAYTLFKEGNYQYWFTAEEIAAMFGNNEDFQVATEEYELLHEHYEVVQDVQKATVHLMTTQVLTQLQQKSHRPLNLKRLSEALKKSKGIQRTSRASGGNKVWYLRERSDDEKRERSKAELPVEINQSKVSL